jgi:cobalamin biosynthetic protein CobC
MAILHGGQLSRIALEYNIPENQWLDLSTGIAPFSYPIPNIPLKVWQDLPTITENLLNVSKQYYQAKYCWPVSGSQSLIEKLPIFWRKKNNLKENLVQHVYLPKVGYKEHQHAWSQQKTQLHFYQQELPENIVANSVVVVINPNNPLNDKFDINALKLLQWRCEKSHSLLIIDEAFADILEPEFSFVPHIREDMDNVLVLRSFGKFFGLAGIRIGFVCCGLTWFNIIKQNSGPWAINGPALMVATKAFQDKNWHKSQIERLQTQSEKQFQLISEYMSIIHIQINALFITVFLNNAPEIFHLFCQHGLYVRLTDENNALRFGIANEAQLKQLQSIFKAVFILPD